MSDVEQVLVGGAQNRGRVVRVGDTVRRPLGSASPAVHRLLQHLAEAGFDGAPRYLGVDDQGREVLSFIPGEVALPPLPPWSRAPAAAESLARLLRRYHEAVAGLDPGAAHDWDSHVPPPWCEGTTVGHNDTVRSNVVFRNGVAVALIDFDRAAPSTPAFELGVAAGQWIPLRGEEDNDDRAGALRTGARLRAFLDAYGASPLERIETLDVIVGNEDRSECSLRALRDQGVPAYVELWEGGAAQRIRDRQKWLGRHLGTLRRLLE